MNKKELIDRLVVVRGQRDDALRDIMNTTDVIKKFKLSVRCLESGRFMVKQVNHNTTMVRWNVKTDNTADTLEESIKLFLKN